MTTFYVNNVLSNEYRCASYQRVPKGDSISSISYLELFPVADNALRAPLSQAGMEIIVVRYYSRTTCECDNTADRKQHS